jgi:hypothetical protein
LQLVGVKWANPVMTICVALPSQDGQYTNHDKADAQNPLQQMGVARINMPMIIAMIPIHSPVIFGMLIPHLPC